MSKPASKVPTPGAGTPRDGEVPPAPLSPKAGSACAETEEANLPLQLQQFLDGWSFRVLDSGLCKTWGRRNSLEILVQVFELNGAVFDPAERSKLCEIEDDRALIQRLQQAMPADMREGFERLAPHLLLALGTTGHVRRCLDVNDAEALQKTIENPAVAGVAQRVLHHGVCAASQEAQNIRKIHGSWLLNSQARLLRLEKCSDDAERCAQQLRAIEAQLETFGVKQNGKSKKVLMGIADGKDKVLKQTVYSSWLGCMLKAQGEKAIRDRFEKQIADAEDKLIAYQEKQLGNVRNVLMRKGAESEACLLHLCVETWQEELAEIKKEGDSAEKLRAAQAKLASYSAGQAENTKKVMSRMAADSDEALITLIWQSWNTFVADYKKDKETEDAVKKAEQAVQEYLKQKSEKARGVLDSMSSGSDSGLIAMIMRNWTEFHLNEKKDREMQDLLTANNEKFKSLNSRQIGNARGVQTRINDQVNTNMLLQIFCSWLLHVKTERIHVYYGGKMVKKKQQLHEIQSIFHSFAKSLDGNLEGVDARDGDSSGRRSERRSRRAPSAPQRSPTSSKVDQLPDIHQRPVPAF